MPPSEPNRKIEELLQSYRRARREELGAGLELHAVSRKALLSEASHGAPATMNKQSSFRRIMEWWRWFFVGAIAIWIVGLCLYIEMPPPRAAIQPAAPIKIVASEHARRRLEMPASETRAATAAPAADRSLAVAAASAPAPVNAAFADAVAVPSRTARTVNTDTLTAASGSLAKDKFGANKAEQAVPPGGALGGAAGVSADRSQFVQVAAKTQYRENVQAPPLPKVLRAFEIARTGDTIVVTDADGSVYEGTISKKSAAGYSFQAIGMSQYLHEQIIFDGLVVTGDAAAVTGDVQVGSRNEFQLNARPAR